MGTIRELYKRGIVQFIKGALNKNRLKEKVRILTNKTKKKVLLS